MKWIVLRGHLTRPELQRALAPLEAELGNGQGKEAVAVDCREMTSYDNDARELFVSWNARMRDRISAVVVVTERRMWHLIVNTMALVSKQRMAAVDTPELAERWLSANNIAR